MLAAPSHLRETARSARRRDFAILRRRLLLGDLEFGAVRLALRQARRVRARIRRWFVGGAS